MSYDNFQLMTARSAGGVLDVSLKNPPVNLLDAKLIREINALAKALAADSMVKVVVVARADPDFFLCHSDERELLALPKSEGNLRNEIGPFHKVIERFRLLPQLTIAKINGIARGGGLAFLLAFDMRFAAANRSKFALPEVAVGLIPGGGGTQRLPRIIGYSRALYLLTGCEDIDALTAERWGLVDRALPDDKLDRWVDEFADWVGSFPIKALHAAKQAVAASSLPIVQCLLEEERLFDSLLRDGSTRARIEAFRGLGSQDRQSQVADFQQVIQVLMKG